MEYKCILVESGSDHHLAKYVEDDEDLFVVSDDNWWRAEDFFNTKGEIKFKEIKGE